MILTEADVLARFSRNAGAPGGRTAVLDAWHDAEEYVAERCEWPTVDADGNPVAAPATLAGAVRLLIRRGLSRENSPDGLVSGSEDFGPVRISSNDPDVERRLGPWRKVVLG